MPVTKPPVTKVIALRTVAKRLIAFAETGDLEAISGFTEKELSDDDAKTYRKAGQTLAAKLREMPIAR